MDKEGGCSKSEAPIEKSFLAPEFIPYSPDTELIFPPALHKHEFKPLAFGNKKKRWYRPVNLQQLLEIKSAYPEAKVIGGSTETQIEIKFKALQYEDSVYVGDIAELKQYSFTDEYLELGANVSLTDLETICDEAVDRYGSAKAQPFIAIKKQIRYFAGRQIRNVASPAGNIATASPISDLNPVFVATNTVLVAQSLEGETEIPMRQFFKGYRRTALEPKAIVAKLRIPVSQESGEYLRAYKQSKRKDDDIAIVNAALRVCLSPSHVVTSADLAYGGMAPTTVSAFEAEQYLVGKTWIDPTTLEGVIGALERDFDLPSSVPGGMPTYRKTLAFGFFYRFYHEVLSLIQPDHPARDEDSVVEIDRAISKGQKDHTAASAYEQNVLGKPLPHVSALKHSTGEAQYTDDIPVQRNELYGCMVISGKARAKILSVDFAPALEIPGVVDFINHQDLPNEKANWWGEPKSDEVFFAVNEVFTAGQPIGMVLATSARLAEAGMRKVKIEYDELPPILSIEDAIEAGSYFDHIRPEIRKGDPEAAFATADHIFTGTCRMGGQEHFYLETQACVAIPKLEDGEMEIWSSTQNPAET
jgi:xanthine dehydrogenase/oxidase